MERGCTSISRLKKWYEKGDKGEILSCLLQLKKHLRGIKNVNDVDTETFEILINLIQNPNSKIMDMSISILADCCLSDKHRKMFSDLGGIPHLLLIMKTVDNDDILCRACRLLGNLASSNNVASVLNEEAGPVLFRILETADEKSCDTVRMTFRAMKKLCASKQCRWDPSQNTTTILLKYLNSTYDEYVKFALEVVKLNASLIVNEGSEVKKVLTRLAELTWKTETTELSMNALTYWIGLQKRNGVTDLEGTGIPEAFIHYLMVKDVVGKDCLKAFFYLCTESVVRDKVKVARLLPAMLKFCHGSCPKEILRIFSTFPTDDIIELMLPQLKKFISCIIPYITQDIWVVMILSAMCRNFQGVNEILMDENWNAIIKSVECPLIFKNLIRTKRGLREVIAAGKVWDIARKDTSFTSREPFPHEQDVLAQMLLCGQDIEKEHAALAVPYFVLPSFSHLHKILVRCGAIQIIVRLLQERTQDEQVLACVVNLLKRIWSNGECRMLIREPFEGWLMPKERSFRNVLRIKTDEVPRFRRNGDVDPGLFDPEEVVFRTNCGSLVRVNKEMLCKNSPVLDAMLNGHFAEANQEVIAFGSCSSKALLNLAELLKSEKSIERLDIETHLELIILTDMLLLPDLSDYLIETVTVDEFSCVTVLEWCLKNKHPRFSDVRQQACTFVFSSPSNLLLAMKSNTLRSAITIEISEYLNLE